MKVKQNNTGEYTSENVKGSEWIMNDGDWNQLDEWFVFVLDAATDYSFVNHTTLIEYYLINLSYLTSDTVIESGRKMDCRERKLVTGFWVM